MQWNIADESALEAAFRLAGKDGSVTVLTMGPPKLEDPLLELLARGANRAVLITDRLMAGADTRATARALASAAEKLGQVDAVFCGCKAIDGETGHWRRRWGFPASPMRRKWRRRGMNCWSPGGWKTASRI